MIEIPKALVEGQWLYGLFLVAFLLLVFLKLVYPVVLYRDVLMVLTMGDSKADMREQKKWRTYDFLVNILFSYIIAMFYVLSINQLNIYEQPSVTLFINFGLIVLGLLMAKHILDVIVSWLFNIKDYFRKVDEKMIALRLAMVVILLPMLFILYYSGLWKEISSTVFIFYCFVFMLLLYIVFIGKFLSTPPSNLFFFILYLCTVEICPLLVLYTLLSRGYFTV